MWSRTLIIVFILFCLTLSSNVALGQCPLELNSTCIAEMQNDLKLELRDLWEDQIIWTHMLIGAVSDNSTDKEAIAERIMKNSKKIGNALKPYYNRSECEKYGDLVKEITLDVVSLAELTKEENNAMSVIDGKILQSINDIVNFENSTNPNWDIDARKKIWNDYLNFTKSDALISLTNNRTPSIDNFDQIEIQANLMADSLATGIITQALSYGGVAVVNRDECVSCGTCVEECPEEAIFLDCEEVAVVIKRKCTECKTCVDACPSEAISME
jgi:ferredoxin